jgi:hypothetical protein
VPQLVQSELGLGCALDKDFTPDFRVHVPSQRRHGPENQTFQPPLHTVIAFPNFFFLLYAIANRIAPLLYLSLFGLASGYFTFKNQLYLGTHDQSLSST